MIMTFRWNFSVFMLLIFALCFCPGCGGGGGGGSNANLPGEYIGRLTSNSPSLDDGSRYEEIELAGTNNGQATLSLNSPSFDAYLVVTTQDPDGTEEVVAEDDDSGGGTNCAVTISVAAGTRYKALISTADDATSGDFTLRFPESQMSLRRSAYPSLAGGTNP
jgi:hypothetical protein